MKYKYGVEYETNGKKPDLPDDVVVWYENPVSGFNSEGKIYNLNFHHISKFRIVDERYKPAEVELVHGRTPKKDLSDFYIQLSSIAHELIDTGEIDYAKRLTELSKEIANKQRQKLADEERKLFENQVLSAIDGTAADCDIVLINTLFEAGCRFTENKAAS